MAMTDPAMNLPMAKAAELMGVRYTLDADRRGPLLTITAPYAVDLPLEFVEGCRSWCDTNGHRLRIADAATGRRVVLRMRQ